LKCEDSGQIHARNQTRQLCRREQVYGQDQEQLPEHQSYQPPHGFLGRGQQASEKAGRSGGCGQKTNSKKVRARVHRSTFKQAMEEMRRRLKQCSNRKAVKQPRDEAGIRERYQDRVSAEIRRARMAIRVTIHCAHSLHAPGG
jgi:hypothetical protein